MKHELELTTKSFQKIIKISQLTKISEYPDVYGREDGGGLRWFRSELPFQDGFKSSNNYHYQLSMSGVLFNNKGEFK